MSQALDYTVPVLHPLLVHFPIVLSLAAALCAAGWLVSDRSGWLRAAVWMGLAGWVGALAAYLTGEEMEEQSEGAPIVEALVETHESLGLASLWILGAGVLVLLMARYISARDSARAGAHPALRWTGALLMVAAALTIALTAHFGGLMVWGVAR